MSCVRSSASDTGPVALTSLRRAAVVHTESRGSSEPPPLAAVSAPARRLRRSRKGAHVTAPRARGRLHPEPTAPRRSERLRLAGLRPIVAARAAHGGQTSTVYWPYIAGPVRIAPLLARPHSAAIQRPPSPFSSTTPTRRLLDYPFREAQIPPRRGFHGGRAASLSPAGRPPGSGPPDRPPPTGIRPC